MATGAVDGCGAPVRSGTDGAKIGGSASGLGLGRAGIAVEVGVTGTSGSDALAGADVAVAGDGVRVGVGRAGAGLIGAAVFRIAAGTAAVGVLGARFPSLLADMVGLVALVGDGTAVLVGGTYSEPTNNSLPTSTAGAAGPSSNPKKSGIDFCKTSSGFFASTLSVLASGVGLGRGLRQAIEPSWRISKPKPPIFHPRAALSTRIVSPRRSCRCCRVAAFQDARMYSNSSSLG